MRYVFRVVEELFALQLGHKGTYRPDNDVVKDFFGYAQVLDSSFKNKVSNGEVKAIQGEIKRLSKDGLELADGSKVPCDALICATGFSKSYNYLPAESVKALDVQRDGLYLYRHVLPSRVPDLAFVGGEVATISNITTYGIQAEWLMGIFSGRVKLPDEKAMQADIDKVREWKRSWMSETGSRANLVLLYQIHYHDILLKELGIPHRRKGANWLAEIFAPYQPRDYGSVLTTRLPAPASV
mmetsp:Transcript_23623/g.63763  ORF Transcript_23623/g.63763 Transcript_23623/m.63763 type:complete len:240 (+) Transcript_23623:828-1547(+)